MPGWWASRSRPEHAQPAGELFQAGVIHRGLAFLQVVDQQVADGLAGQVVPVDHLLGGALARGAQLPQPRRRGRAEDPQLAQQPVAGSSIGPGGAEHVSLGVQQLQQVADLDVGEHPALGGHDHRGPAQRVRAGRLRPRPPGIGRTAPAAGRSPAGHGMRPWPGPGSACRIRWDQPGQRRAHDVAAEAASSAAAACSPAGPGRAAAASHRAGSSATRPPGGLGAAGQPALLPAAAVLVFQPVQQQPQPADAAPGRRACRTAPASCSRTCSRAARWPASPAAPAAAGTGSALPGSPPAIPPRPRAARPTARGHDVCFPNSTSRLSGR